MRFSGVILLVGLLSNTRLAGETADFIAALVNDAIITQREVEEYTAQALDLLRRTYYHQPAVLQQRATETLQDGLEQLLEKQLILYDFKTSGAKLPESVIEDEVKRRIRQRFGDRITLTKTLQAQGITYETFRKRTKDDFIVWLMTERNVKSAVLISPQKVEQYYGTNQIQFKLGDQVKLRMIVLNRSAGTPGEEIRKLAQEILTKIEQGASFAEMAGIYSEGSQRREGGDWGWVEASKLNKGLAEIAFTLQAGQHSSVMALAKEGSDVYWIYQYNPAGHITTARKYSDKGDLLEEKKFEQVAADGNGNGNGNGVAPPAPPQEFYLMLVEEKRIARTKSLPEVREEIEKSLMVQERARLHKQWIDRLRTKAFVRYF